LLPAFTRKLGGVETHVFEIARRMREFDVEVLATDPSGKLAKAEEIEEIKVRRFKSFAPGNAYFFSPELWSYLKRHSADYDLIHAHNFHAFPALYAALSRPKKLVFTPHYHGQVTAFSGIFYSEFTGFTPEESFTKLMQLSAYRNLKKN
jgi:glycosyltransferase involved in cell wall biosynthesis